eukprot:COSAG03_NODE_83_length_13818_cov_11.329543_5_plen_212_part_00
MERPSSSPAAPARASRRPRRRVHPAPAPAPLHAQGRTVEGWDGPPRLNHEVYRGITIYSSNTLVKYRRCLYLDVNSHRNCVRLTGTMSRASNRFGSLARPIRSNLPQCFTACFTAGAMRRIDSPCSKSLTCSGEDPHGGRRCGRLPRDAGRRLGGISHCPGKPAVDYPGKPAVSHCWVLERRPGPGVGTSLLAVEIETGRPHQIRQVKAAT